MQEDFETRDEQVVPFLFMQRGIRFLGTRVVGGFIYFRFFPYSKCISLVNDFVMRKSPLVQPKDLLEAVETHGDIVSEMKEKMGRYETQEGINV